MTNKEKLIINLFYYWLGYFHIRMLNVRRDNKIDCSAEVVDYENEEKLWIRYNFNKIKYHKICYIYLIVFHEIGHIIQKMPYDTDEEQIVCENKAETFAFKQLKKYCPKEYKKCVTYIRKNKCLNRFKRYDPLYYDAFKNIPEYNKG